MPSDVEAAASEGRPRGDHPLLGPMLLLAFTLALFGDVLVSRAPVFLSSPAGDLQSQGLPWRTFGFRELSHGNLPLWNPHSFAGRAFAGDFQSALFYPPNWIHAVLPPRWAANVSIVLHVYLAGLFAYLWGRSRGLSTIGALLTGLVWMLSGPVYLHVYAGHLTVLGSLPWTPLVFLALDAYARDRDPAWLLAGIGAVCFQILAGHPQYAYATALAAFAYAMLHAVVRPRTLWPLRGFLVIYAGAAALAAVQLLTAMDVGRETARWRGMSFAGASTFSLPLENLATAVSPYLFGDSLRLDYFGRWYFWEVNVYVGVAALVLAAHASGPARPRFAWVLVGLALVLALGDQTPVFGALYRYVPAGNVFRAPGRLAFIATLFLACLAGTGFDRLRSSRRATRGAVAVTGSVALVFLASSAVVTRWPALWTALLNKIATAPLRLTRSDLLTDAGFAAVSARFTSDQLRVTAAVLLLAALLLAAARRGWSAQGLALLGLVELGAFAWHYRATSPERAYPSAWEDVAASAGAARVLEPVLFSNEGMSRGWLDIWGYESNPPARYDRLLREAWRYGVEGIARYPGLFQMLRCAAVLRVGATGTPIVTPLSDPMPRASLVRDYSRPPDEAATVDAVLAPRFDPRRSVILETVPAPAPDPTGTGGTVKILSSSTDDLELEVDTERPALLLVTDAYGEGWRVSSLSGSAQPAYALLRADFVLRAVPLGGGHHHLRMEYLPWGFRIGRWVSVAALILYVACWLQVHRRRARHEPVPTF